MYKTRYDWVENMIYRILCQKFKFDNWYKWYIHNPESVLENEMHKLLWDLEIQMNHLVSAWWPDPMIVNKKRDLVD